MTSCVTYSPAARCSMTPVAAEWVAKAEGDFAIMQRESRARQATTASAFTPSSVLRNTSRRSWPTCKYPSARRMTRLFCWSRCLPDTHSGPLFEMTWHTSRRFRSLIDIQASPPTKRARATPHAGAASSAVWHDPQWGLLPDYREISSASTASNSACPGSGGGITCTPSLPRCMNCRSFSMYT